tara:strand:- start:4484 stop:4786 length:303 start_codon:yes stop_codon:yes gene_type:complete
MFELKIKSVFIVSKNTTYMIDNIKPIIIKNILIKKIKIIEIAGDENSFFCDKTFNLFGFNLIKLIAKIHIKNEDTNTPKLEPKNKLVNILNLRITFIGLN